MIRMILGVLVFALLLILGGVLAQMMVADPGVIMISWRGYLLETTFWGGIGVGLTIIIVLIILLLLIRRFGPQRLLTKYRLRRDRKMAKKETLIAIDSWLSGDEDRALKALARVAQAGGSERLPKAVSLAIGLTHGDWMDRYTELLKDDPELKLFAQSLMAERLWQSQKFDEFIELLDNHFDLRQITWLRDRYWNSLLVRGDAITLVKMVNEAAHVTPQLRQQWLLKAVNEALVQAGSDESKAQQVLKTLSKSQRKLPEVIAAEVRHLMLAGQHDVAFKRLKPLLNDGDLKQVGLLLDLKLDNLQKLKYLEALQPSQPGPEFCRTLGVLNLRQQLWGNAQSWLEKGWAQGDRASGIQLAELLEQRKMDEQANRLYRQLATSHLVLA